MVTEFEQNLSLTIIQAIGPILVALISILLRVKKRHPRRRSGKH